MDDDSKFLSRVIGDLDGKLAAETRARSIIEIATLTLLIGRGGLAIEEVTERIAQIQRALPERFQDPEVSLRLQIVTDSLRALFPQPSQKGAFQIIQGGFDPTQDPHQEP